jgi:LysR family transcriptional regulator, transcriptional activator of nhaA
MEWLNYHHLFYFWTVAREGSISKACQILKLSQPTISAQIKTLEDFLNEPLFKREGRGLKLTETGELIFQYSEEIFGLGREMLDTVRGMPSGRTMILRVGITDVVPKLVAYRLIEPALKLGKPIKLQCVEDKPEKLLGELSVHGLDIVLSDSTMPPYLKVKAYSHLLGECSVSLFASEKLAPKYRRNFPRSLQGAPLLLPLRTTALRRSFDHWSQSLGIYPNVVGEFQDSALLHIFGQSGTGIVIGHSVIEKEIISQYKLKLVGRIPEIRESYYAISVERKVTHPAVAAICARARTTLARS